MALWYTFFSVVIGGRGVKCCVGGRMASSVKWIMAFAYNNVEMAVHNVDWCMNTVTRMHQEGC